MNFAQKEHGEPTKRWLSSFNKKPQKLIFQDTKQRSDTWSFDYLPAQTQQLLLLWQRQSVQDIAVEDALPTLSSVGTPASERITMRGKTVATSAVPLSLSFMVYTAQFVCFGVYILPKNHTTDSTHWKLQKKNEFRLHIARRKKIIKIRADPSGKIALLANFQLRAISSRPPNGFQLQQGDPYDTTLQLTMYIYI